MDENPEAGANAGEAEAAKLELLPSRQFPAWLAEQRLSLAFSTNQIGKLFLIGLQPGGRLSIFERTFNRAMGLWSDSETLYLVTLFQHWRFENELEPGQTHDGCDRLFAPQLAWTTGDLDIHDIAVDTETGDVVHWLRIDGMIGELYDVTALPGVIRPAAIGLVTDEIRRMIRVVPQEPL